MTEDEIMSMPPGVYWLKGRKALAAGFLSPATWEGQPRSDRYRLVPAAMNGQSAALAYVRGQDDHCCTAVCLKEFHTLNRCLDTAIAEAVTEFARVTATAT